jgi:hypothetical protein
MKRILLVVTLILLGSFSGAAKLSPAPPLLEAHVSSVGMVAVAGDYLFLRVLDDGQIEYEDEVFENNVHKFALRKSKLSSAQLNELKTFLNDPELQKVAQEYEPDVPTIDHVATFDISIIRDTKSQVIKLTNYHPSFPEARDKYPAKLIELVCLMRSLRRHSAKFRIILNDCSFS